MNPHPLPVSRRQDLAPSRTGWRKGLGDAPHPRGFALIVTIVLVSFLVLILLGLATFTRVETQVATNTQNLAQARQNALFALHVALGELQRSAGPDQRITATATIGENNPRTDLATYGITPPRNGTRHWTGVWGGYRDDNFHLHRPAHLTWLVSGNNSAAFSAETTNIARFGEITSNPGGTAPSASVTNLLGNPEAIPDSGSSITFGPSSLAEAESSLLGPASTAFDSFTIAGRDAALLVGPNTVGAAVADYVLAPIESIRSPLIPGLDPAAAPDPAGYEVGRYAWWIGDEGVKARADLVDVRRNSNNASIRRLRSQLAPRFGLEHVSGLSAYSQSPATGPSPEQALFLEQLGFVDGLSANDVKTRFHDLTTHSFGVLADVSKGGLKKDLTAGLLGSTAPPGLGDNDEIFADLLPSSLPGTRPARLPSWGSLRSYVQLGHPTTGLLSGNNPTVTPRPTTDTQVGIHPVVLRFQLWITPTANAANSAVDLVYLPAIVLWNPYDVTLAPTTYGVWFGTTRETGTAANYAHPSLMPIVGMASKPASPAPTGTTPFSHAYYATGNLPIDGLGFVLAPTAIPPGEAIVFTLDENDDLTDAGALKPASQRVLRPGFRLHFLRDTGVITIPADQVGQRATVTLSIPNDLLSDFELRSGASFNAGGRPTGTLLQRVAGVRWAAPRTSTGNYLPVVGPVSSPLVVAGPGIDAAGTDGFPSGNHYRYNGSQAASIKQLPSSVFPLTPSDFLLAVGLLGIMDGSVNETSSLWTSGSQQITQNAIVRGKWIANQNPAAPEHNLAANDGANVTNAQYWSAGLYGNHDSNAIFINNNNGSVTQLQTLRANYDNIIVATDGDENAYVANPGDPSGDSASATLRCILFHLPRRETGVVSLGALQHAQLTPATGQLDDDPGYTASATPAYAIGNSFADPRVQPATSLRTSTNANHVRGLADWSGLSLNPDRSSRNFHFDLSYLVNQALWDRYYFSTVPLAGTPAFPLRNPRHALWDPANLGVAALASDLRDFDRAASRLLLAGAFNANSTSVEAWKALLSSTLGAPVLDADDADVAVAGEVAFPRLPFPRLGAVAGSSGMGTPAIHSGFRSLSAAEIDRLAAEIVRSVRLHGPFPSMARLVNRNPTASLTAGIVGWADYMGPLQLAIDRSAAATDDLNLGGNLNNPNPTFSRINDHLASAAAKTKPTVRNNSNLTLPNYNYNAGAGIRSGTSVFERAPSGLANAAAAAPGYLTQADLLQILGPVLSVRSDTFRIRTFGEVRNPATGEVTGRAWCEAIVQRLPDFVDDTQPAHLWMNATGTAMAINAENQRFGRRFRIVSFRWLTPSDI